MCLAQRLGRSCGRPSCSCGFGLAEACRRQPIRIGEVRPAERRLRPRLGIGVVETSYCGCRVGEVSCAVGCFLCPLAGFRRVAGGVDASSNSRRDGVGVERLASRPGIESELDLGDGAVHDEPRLPQRSGVTGQGPLGDSRRLGPLAEGEMHLRGCPVEEPPMKGIDGSRLGLREQSMGALAVASARSEHGAGKCKAHLS